MDELVEAAWAELKRQANDDKGNTPYVDREINVIDGEVNIPALITAIITVYVKLEQLRKQE